MGVARPKANILGKKGNLWIVKFPSNGDIIYKAASEFLSNKLAIKAGIEMSEFKIEMIGGKYNNFSTKRFDRIKPKRFYFASALTMPRLGFKTRLLCAIENCTELKKTIIKPTNLILFMNYND